MIKIITQLIFNYIIVFRSKVVHFFCCLVLFSLLISPVSAFNLHDTNTPVVAAAIKSFEGEDRTKNGVMAKAGYDLALIYHEHRDYLNKGGFKFTKKQFRSSNKLARIKDEKIVIDTAAAGDANVLVESLKKLGMENVSVFGRNVSGYLPIASLEKASGLAVLRMLRASYVQVMTGTVTSQGDIALAANDSRNTYAVDGAGITVGTLSNSFNCKGGATGDVVSNDLPAGINVLADETGCTSGTDEGRAMMQIIHDIAPGVQQQFHSGFNGMADFANGIIALANAGSDIINDDVIYLAEPMFQDGIVAQAVDQVKAMGVAYFSSAGNNGSQSYEAPFINSGVRGYRPQNRRHDFDSGTAIDSLMQVTIPTNKTVSLVLQWDDPFYSVSGLPGADTDMDIFLYSSTGQVLEGSMSSNIGGDPVEILQFTNPNITDTVYQIAIDYVNGPEPGRLKFVYFGSMTINEYATNSASSYGHALASGGQGVGAALYSKTPAYNVTPPLVESFSSKGGITILFDTAGNPVSETRLKPDFVAPDGVDTTFFGSDFEGNGFPNFFGTSAAVPHAAAMAALIKSINVNLTPDEIYTVMRNTTVDMSTTGFDYKTGYGLLQANTAVTLFDIDLDGILDSRDNCPSLVNPNQENNDKDLQGDVCDPDDDNDGLNDVDEITWGTNSFISDTDHDGISDGDEVYIYDMNPVFSDKGNMAPRAQVDAQVDIADYVVHKRIILGELIPSYLESILADMNDDGQLDVKDLVLIEQRLLLQ